jgi:hypothetical protein
MNRQLPYGTTSIDYVLSFTERKTLGIRVDPEGEVTVTAPLGTEQVIIDEKLLKKAAWIRRQRDFFLSFRPLTTERRYVSGETHLYLGKRYRLKVHRVAWDIDEGVKLERGYLHLRTMRPEDQAHSHHLMAKFYEVQAALHFPKLLDARLSAARRYYAGPVNLKIKWLAKRWGTCRRSGTITLNYELIRAPKECIEYVIVHELCHLAHFSHDKAFFKLLEREWPGWKKVKDRLELMLS